MCAENIIKFQLQSQFQIFLNQQNFGPDLDPKHFDTLIVFWKSWKDFEKSWQTTKK